MIVCVQTRSPDSSRVMSKIYVALPQGTLIMGARLDPEQVKNALENALSTHEHFSRKRDFSSARMHEWFRWKETHADGKSGFPELWFCHECGRGIFVYQERDEEEGIPYCAHCTLAKEEYPSNRLAGSMLPENLRTLLMVPATRKRRAQESHSPTPRARRGRK
jgi:hypothetical protein